MSFGERPGGGEVIIGECVFPEEFEVCGRKRASKRFLVNLRKLRAFFLHFSASVGFSDLGLLVGRWRDRRRKVSRSLEEG